MDVVRQVSTLLSTHEPPPILDWTGDRMEPCNFGLKPSSSGDCNRASLRSCRTFCLDQTKLAAASSSTLSIAPPACNVMLYLSVIACTVHISVYSTVQYCTLCILRTYRVLELEPRAPFQGLTALRAASSWASQALLPFVWGLVRPRERVHDCEPQVTSPACLPLSACYPPAWRLPLAPRPWPRREECPPQTADSQSRLPIAPVAVDACDEVLLGCCVCVATTDPESIEFGAHIAVDTDPWTVFLFSSPPS